MASEISKEAVEAGRRAFYGSGSVLVDPVDMEAALTAVIPFLRPAPSPGDERDLDQVLVVDDLLASRTPLAAKDGENARLKDAIVGYADALETSRREGFALVEQRAAKDAEIAVLRRELAAKHPRFQEYWDHLAAKEAEIAAAEVAFGKERLTFCERIAAMREALQRIAKPQEGDDCLPFYRDLSRARRQWAVDVLAALEMSGGGGK